jgi:ribose-phosphate pyrophosphokinase
MAQLLECAGTGRVMTLDVHNAAALDNAFRIPVDHLSAIPMMVARLNNDLPNGPLAVASPDIGGIKRAQTFRELLERKAGRPVELLFIEKRRDGTVISGGTVIGDAGGRAVIVVDDLCASGSTLTRAAVALLDKGATSVHAAVTHTPIESGLANIAAASEIKQVIITDSVGYGPNIENAAHLRKITVLSAGELLGCAIGRMIRGEPLASLTDQWPPTDA